MPPDPPPADDIAGNWSSSAEQLKFHDRVQHGAYQAANWLLVVSLLVPHHTFAWTIFASRVLMAAAFALTACWACVELCAPDVFAWNALLTAASLVHVAYWSWRFRPARRLLQRPLLELYEKLFVPLDCPRELFVQLTGKSSVRHLLPGHDYFSESSSSSSSSSSIRLSILLTGKLRVTFGAGERLLHYVDPFQFIDSPEWYYATHQHSPDGAKISSPQVSIRAMEPSTYLQLDVELLRHLMATNLPLKFLLDCLIGKDVSEKLYAVAEQTAALGGSASRRQVVVGGSLGVNGGGITAAQQHPLGPWQGELMRSQSADAVHTCTKGQVRSINWRRDQTRKVWERRYEKLVPSSREVRYYRHRVELKQEQHHHHHRRHDAGHQVAARSRRETSPPLPTPRCDHIEEDEDDDDVTLPLVHPSPLLHNNKHDHDDGERQQQDGRRRSGPAHHQHAPGSPSHQQRHHSNSQWCNKVQFGETFV